MKLSTLSSSSAGNCYLLQDGGGNILLIECGLPIKDIKKALKFDISRIVGCVVTHQHNDHAQAIADILKCGIFCYAPRDVYEEKNVASNPFAIVAKPKVKCHMGKFKITPLKAYHDVPCFCYIVEHEEMGKLLFATDTYKLPYKIKGISHLMIECNYVDEVLAFNEENGYCPKSLRDRLMLSHMELETTKKVVEQNLCDELQDVILIHLSNDNSDADKMVQEIEEMLGVPCYVARKGFEIEFNDKPY